MNMQNQIICLPKGKYSFPFSFKLPKNSHPSFEFPLTNHRGYLRYRLIANLISPYIKDNHDIVLYLKSRELLHQNSQWLYTSNPEVLFLGLFSKGFTKLSVSYQTVYYKMHDIIPITVEIDNTHGHWRVEYLKLRIARKVTYRTFQGAEHCLFNNISTKKVKTDTAQSEKQWWNWIIQLKDSNIKTFNYRKQDNPYPDIGDFHWLFPSVNSTLISCEYFIKVTAYFNLFVTHNNRPRAVWPIYVVHEWGHSSDDEWSKIDQCENIQNEINSRNKTPGQEYKDKENGIDGYYNKPCIEEENRMWSNNNNIVSNTWHNPVQEKIDKNGTFNLISGPSISMNSRNDSNIQRIYTNNPTQNEKKYINTDTANGKIQGNHESKSVKTYVNKSTAGGSNSDTTTGEDEKKCENMERKDKRYINTDDGFSLYSQENQVDYSDYFPVYINETNINNQLDNQL